VKSWIAGGKVEAIRLTPAGEWRINRASLERYLESLRSRCSTRPDQLVAPDDETAAGS
jgi:hypothetical protein